MIDKTALFSDETELFKTPYNSSRGDTVTLRLRAPAAEYLNVFVAVNGVKRRMKKAKPPFKNADCGGIFDFYEYSFKCNAKTASYHFIVSDRDGQLYYNRSGAGDALKTEYDFKIINGYSVPDWVRGAVFYQIFPDRFFNGNPANDVKNNEFYYTGGHSVEVRDWNSPPSATDVNRFYGGDLQGVEQKLNYLAGLGVEAIYLNPVFVAPSNHKYDVQDYDYIDPHLAVISDDLEYRMQDWEKHNGYAPMYIRRTTCRENLEESNRYFCSLVQKIHKAGMKIILDGVFNHCGSFNKWMDKEGVYLNKKGYKKGAYQSVKSPYRKFFKFDDPAEAHSGYEGWWNYPTLPKLNYENSRGLVNRILKIGAKWVSAPFCADGWRLDVAADLGHGEEFNHKFWKKFRKAVKTANPEAFILAEHYGSPGKWLNGGEWDSVMNYDAFMEPVSWFLTGMEKHSRAFDPEKYRNGEAFFAAMTKNMAKLPRPALDSALNQLSNHDHSRFLTRTNRTAGSVAADGTEAADKNTDKRIMELAVLIQMTWPGAPGIYYADEAGQTGWTDPDSRRTYPWGAEDKGLLEFHKAAVKLRKKISCLKCGSIMPLCAGDGYIAYGRFDAKSACIVAVNCSDKQIEISLPVMRLGLPDGAKIVPEFLCADENIKSGGEIIIAANGLAQISLPAAGGAVYVCR